MIFFTKLIIFIVFTAIFWSKIWVFHEKYVNFSKFEKFSKIFENFWKFFDQKIFEKKKKNFDKKIEKNVKKKFLKILTCYIPFCSEFNSEQNERCE